MSQDTDQERTEEATPRKLDEAMDEGRIARSQELGTAALFLGMALTLAMVAPMAGRQIVQHFGSALSQMSGASDAANLLRALERTGWTTLTSVALLAAMPTVLALGMGAAQARGVIATKALAPKWNRINPLTNAKNLFSMRAPVELLKALLKLLLFGSVAWIVLRAAWPDLLDLGARDAHSLLATVAHYTTRIFVLGGSAYLALASMDYGWQLWQHAKQLRMTKDEVKREHKQTDGDPMLKSRIRAVARARLRRQMLADVAKADVVIVNPTTRAVALRYDPLAAPAPIVLAMGERKVAERIKELAVEHGIPMIENRPLAIALLASARVGTTIPAELYVAVAEILAFVFRQKARQGKGPLWADGAID